MKIAIFSAQYPPHMGGIESFTQNLAGALAACGDAVTVVTNDTNNQGSGWSAEAGFEILRLPCFPLIDGRFPLPKLNAVRRRLLKELAAREFDGVLVNARFYSHSILGMRFARSKGLTPIVLDHGSAYLSFSNLILDPCVRFYEHVITELGKRYEASYYGISQKSAEWLKTFGIKARGVISNSIDAEKFRQSSSGRDFRKELNLDSSDVLVAFVGRFIPEKGIAAIVGASQSPELIARRVVFALAGDGPLLGEVKAAVGPHLRWLGRLDKGDVSAFLQQANVLCLPSRSEGFSTTLLEAGACGCPAVVTDVGGARELIPDEHYGTIIESMTASSIVAALINLTDNPALLLEQREKSLVLTESSYSWSSTARIVENALS